MDPYGLQNLREGGWAGYMAIANLLIFCPVGFFPALLWRGKSLYAGTSDWLLYFLLRGVPTAVCGAGH